MGLNIFMRSNDAYTFMKDYLRQYCRSKAGMSKRRPTGHFWPAEDFNLASGAFSKNYKIWDSNFETANFCSAKYNTKYTKVSLYYASL